MVWLGVEIQDLHHHHHCSCPNLCNHLLAQSKHLKIQALHHHHHYSCLNMIQEHSVSNVSSNIGFGFFSDSEKIDLKSVDSKKEIQCEDLALWNVKVERFICFQSINQFLDV